MLNLIILKSYGSIKKIASKNYSDKLDFGCLLSAFSIESRFAISFFEFIDNVLIISEPNCTDCSGNVSMNFSSAFL